LIETTRVSRSPAQPIPVLMTVLVLLAVFVLAVARSVDTRRL
jgi:hypothetical protein